MGGTEKTLGKAQEVLVETSHMLADDGFKDGSRCQLNVHCPDELLKILMIEDQAFELGDKLEHRNIFVWSRNSAGMWHKALVEFGDKNTIIQGVLKQDKRDEIIKEYKDAYQILRGADFFALNFSNALSKIKHKTVVEAYEMECQEDSEDQKMARNWKAAINIVINGLLVLIYSKMPDKGGGNCS